MKIRRVTADKGGFLPRRPELQPTRLEFIEPTLLLANVMNGDPNNRPRLWPDKQILVLKCLAKSKVFQIPKSKSSKQSSDASKDLQNQEKSKLETGIKLESDEIQATKIRLDRNTDIDDFADLESLSSSSDEMGESDSQDSSDNFKYDKVKKIKGKNTSFRSYVIELQVADPSFRGVLKLFGNYKHTKECFMYYNPGNCYRISGFEVKDCSERAREYYSACVGRYLKVSASHKMPLSQDPWSLKSNFAMSLFKSMSERYGGPNIEEEVSNNYDHLDSHRLLRAIDQMDRRGNFKSLLNDDLRFFGSGYFVTERMIGTWTSESFDGLFDVIGRVVSKLTVWKATNPAKAYAEIMVGAESEFYHNPFSQEDTETLTKECINNGDRNHIHHKLYDKKKFNTRKYPITCHTKLIRTNNAEELENAGRSHKAYEWLDLEVRPRDPKSSGQRVKIFRHPYFPSEDHLATLKDVQIGDVIMLTNLKQVKGHMYHFWQTPLTRVLTNAACAKTKLTLWAQKLLDREVNYKRKEPQQYRRVREHYDPYTELRNRIPPLGFITANQLFTNLGRSGLDWKSLPPAFTLSGTVSLSKILLKIKCIECHRTSIPKFAFQDPSLASDEEDCSVECVAKLKKRSEEPRDWEDQKLGLKAKKFGVLRYWKLKSYTLEITYNLYQPFIPAPVKCDLWLRSDFPSSKRYLKALGFSAKKVIPEIHHLSGRHLEEQIPDAYKALHSATGLHELILQNPGFDRAETLQQAVENTTFRILHILPMSRVGVRHSGHARGLLSAVKSFDEPLYTSLYPPPPSPPMSPRYVFYGDNSLLKASIHEPRWAEVPQPTHKQKLLEKYIREGKLRPDGSNWPKGEGPTDSRSLSAADQVKEEPEAVKDWMQELAEEEEELQSLGLPPAQVGVQGLKQEEEAEALSGVDRKEEADAPREAEHQIDPQTKVEEAAPAKKEESPQSQSASQMGKLALEGKEDLEKSGVKKEPETSRIVISQNTDPDANAIPVRTDSTNMADHEPKTEEQTSQIKTE